MTIEQLKEQIRDLQPSELDQVAAYILQLRRSKDPGRKTELAAMIDDPDMIPWNKPTEG
jgi:hypothetical protein